MSENLHYSKYGLALTRQEQESLKQAGLEFTGYYNQHQQPILRDMKTGEETPLCRAGYKIRCTDYAISTTEERMTHE